MRAFVVRPFGRREDIDFDVVGRELIAPALAGAEYSGNTTEEIAEAGSIHEDMFLELLGAQLVIADISVHNANVFYELGIRHALRPRATILLRARKRTNGSGAPRADIPFDIHGLRYCAYDPDFPRCALPELERAIKDTDAAYRVDSPVFRLLPDLVADATKLRALPLDLTEQIDLATRQNQAAELRLLAEDVTGLRFEEPALRSIANAQTEVGDGVGAIETWMQLRVARPNDYEANHKLATLYARQPEQLIASDQTIARAFSNPTLTTGQRSELHALRGSNLKRRWLATWCGLDSAEKRRRAAVRSPYLDAAMMQYAEGFAQDLNNYYAGLNALALADLQQQLQRDQSETWQTNFRTELDARSAQLALDERVQRLTVLVDAVLQAKASTAGRSETSDPWVMVSLADAQFLTSNDVARVLGAYERAAYALDSSQRPAVTGQLRLFRDLGLRTEITDSALALVGGAEAEGTQRSERAVLTFIGHMIDAESDHERFPARLEKAAAAAIKRRVVAAHEAAEKAGCRLVGFASASDGGDILFHEACDEVGVASEVYLPVPDELFRSTSRFAPGWFDRYLNLVGRKTLHTMNVSPLVPSWLDLRPETSSWPRFNRWLLHHAKIKADRVTVLALWDGKPARWLGGVANMVEIAPRRGAAVDIIDIRSLAAAVDDTGGVDPATAGSAP